MKLIRLVAFGCMAFLGLLGGGLTLVGQEGSTSSYAPIAPAAATDRALRLSLEIVSDWVRQNDYRSASSSCGELLLLARLYSYQSGAPSWQEKIAQLEGTIRKIQKAATEKDGPVCKKLIDQCSEQLKEMKGKPPEKAALAKESFRASASTKTWMLIMDLAYSEAKFSRQPQDLELFAQALAEEANALGHVRGDSRWRKTSHEVRDLALQAARQARSANIEEARGLLKKANQRCEFCHEGFKR